MYTVVPFLICRGETCLGNGDRVQIPNSMADLNQQLQGIQDQINGHFEGTNNEPLETVPEVEVLGTVDTVDTVGTTGTTETEFKEKKHIDQFIDSAPLD